VIQTIEKRQFDRHIHKEPVEIQSRDLSEPAGALSGDLSSGGIRIYLNVFLPLNTELALQVRLADGRVIECTGRVVWVRKNRFNDNYQVGLEFIGGRSVANIQRMINGYLQTYHRQMA
jgi:c-di-GMP-binding flagellar brake protein YcgR